MPSSSASESGMLRFIAEESAPSATSQPSVERKPASSSRSARGTPVHSLHESRPWIEPHGIWRGSGAMLGALLPEHSMKQVRVESG